VLNHIRCLSIAAVFIAAFLSQPANPAAKGFSFIRDAEIENTIRAYATPLFRAAGLEPSAIRIYLVKDASLNAFVAGGQNLFLNTGLLISSKNANQVIGIIAHETGHIAGGHLSRTHAALGKSTAQTILAFVLGGAAAIGTGRPDLGQAIILGGHQISKSTFLQYSRTQESAADHAALQLLDMTGQSAQGFMEFMDILGDQELLSTKRQDPYVRTHPVTRERITAIRDHTARSPHSAKPASAAFEEAHRRMKAKLYAFLNSRTYTLRLYKESDHSITSRYARAVAHYRRADLGKALPLIDGLIAERPNDPYFHELKGQMLFENRRGPEALKSYRTAVRLKPDSALLRTDLAKIELESNDPALLESAILNLKVAQRYERNVPSTWHQLAIAYGRKGEMGSSALAMAEEAMLRNKKTDARYHAGKAAKLLPRGSRGWLHAQDILFSIDKSSKSGKKK
jgi:predicted Zn-dependent protease